MKEYGKVYLAGAGPGEEDLITLKALNAIKNADVILYDKLANPNLLNYAKDDTEKIFVGKESGHHYVKQEDTIALIIQKAKEGKTTLRLKGGDPLIFGRGAEEAFALMKEGIEFEFIPGITSGLAAAMYSGIPPTCRDSVTQTVLITAHENPKKPGMQVDWENLAKLKHTNLIIYMGVMRMSKISSSLIEFGMDADTPIAIVTNATLPHQETHTSTLDKVGECIEKNNIKPPAIFIIGPTVSMREELKWFD